MSVRTAKRVCAKQRLRSAWASAQSDQSLRCRHEESLGPYLPIECTVKTLIRLAHIQVFNIIHRRQIFFNNINCAKLKSATFTALSEKFGHQNNCCNHLKIQKIRFCHQSNACKLSDKHCRLWSSFRSNLIWVYNAYPDLTVWKKKDHYINQSTSNAKTLGSSCSSTIKILKHFGHPKNCCNNHILLTMWFFHKVMGPKGADRIPWSY